MTAPRWQGLQGRESVELIPNVLSLTFFRNGEATFGTGAGFTEASAPASSGSVHRLDPSGFFALLPELPE